MLQLAFLLCAVVLTQSSHELIEDRQNLLNRIQKHELIHINLDNFPSKKQISFEAFNKHYTVQLTVNEHALPTLLQPNEDGTFTELDIQHEESCYYHGRVLDIDGGSSVALSLCEKRGIRGVVHVFGEDQMRINPTSYYHAPLDSSAITDEHLIYKASDYHTDFVPECRSIRTSDDAFEEETHETRDILRRLRATDGKAGYVELVTLINKGYGDYLGGASKAINYFSDVVSEASAMYTNTNLPDDVELSIRYRYAVFDDPGSCTGYGSCVPLAKRYLSRINKKFDYGFAFFRDSTMAKRGEYYGEGGETWGNGICKSGENYGAAFFSSKTNTASQGMAAMILAHELGHNLMSVPKGADVHDDSTSNIMHPNGGAKVWTSRMIRYLRNNKNSGRWNCLKSSQGSGYVAWGNYDNKAGGSMNVEQEEDTNCVDTYENAMCFYSDNLNETIPTYLVFDLIEDEGCFNGEAVFGAMDKESDDMFYLYRGEYGNAWIITDGEGVSNEMVALYVCEESDLRNCTQGKWAREDVRDDMIEMEVIAGVMIEECAVETQSIEKKKRGVDMSLILSNIIVLLVCILIGCALYIWKERRSRSRNKGQFEIKDDSGDDEEIEITANINTTR